MVHRRHISRQDSDERSWEAVLLKRTRHSLEASRTRGAVQREEGKAARLCHLDICLTVTSLVPASWGGLDSGFAEVSWVAQSA